jgi:hypothetical protein
MRDFLIDWMRDASLTLCVGIAIAVSLHLLAKVLR